MGRRRQPQYAHTTRIRSLRPPARRSRISFGLARTSDNCIGAGLHCSPWAEPKRGAHVARAIGSYMLAQTESGVYCPISMTYGSVTTLKHAPEIAAEWLPRIFSRQFTTGAFSPQRRKTSALIGMAMTENQGGSDLRANVSRAEFYASRRARGGSTGLTDISGSCLRRCAMRFWCSPKQSAGPTCFLVPRWTPEGDAQHDSYSPSQGQARQSLECLERGGVRRHARRTIWARKAAEFRPSSRWETSRGSIAPSDRQR